MAQPLRPPRRDSWRPTARHFMPKTMSDPCPLESATPTIGMLSCARTQAGIQASSTRSQPAGSGCGSASGGVRVRVRVRRTVPPRGCPLCSMLRGGQSSLLRSLLRSTS